MIAYYLLKCRQAYHDLGSNYFEELHRQRLERNLVRRLEKLGYEVTLEAFSPGGLSALQEEFSEEISPK